VEVVKKWIKAKITGRITFLDTSELAEYVGRKLAPIATCVATMPIPL